MLSTAAQQPKNTQSKTDKAVTTNIMDPKALLTQAWQRYSSMVSPAFDASDTVLATVGNQINQFTNNIAALKASPYFQHEACLHINARAIWRGEGALYYACGEKVPKNANIKLAWIGNRLIDSRQIDNFQHRIGWLIQKHYYFNAEQVDERGDFYYPANRHYRFMQNGVQYGIGSWAAHSNFDIGYDIINRNIVFDSSKKLDDNKNDFAMYVQQGIIVTYHLDWFILNAYSHAVGDDKLNTIFQVLVDIIKSYIAPIAIKLQQKKPVTFERETALALYTLLEKHPLLLEKIINALSVKYPEFFPNPQTVHAYFETLESIILMSIPNVKFSDQNREMTRKTNEIAQLKNEVKQLRDQNKALTVEKNKIESQINPKKNSASELRKATNDLRDEKQKASDRVKTFQMIIANNNTKITALETKVNSQEKEIKLLEKKVKNLTAINQKFQNNTVQQAAPTILTPAPAKNEIALEVARKNIITLEVGNKKLKSKLKESEQENAWHKREQERLTARIQLLEEQLKNNSTKSVNETPVISVEPTEQHHATATEQVVDEESTNNKEIILSVSTLTDSRSIDDTSPQKTETSVLAENHDITTLTNALDLAVTPLEQTIMTPSTSDLAAVLPPNGIAQNSQPVEETIVISVYAQTLLLHLRNFTDAEETISFTETIHQELEKKINAMEHDELERLNAAAKLISDVTSLASAALCFDKFSELLLQLNDKIHIVETYDFIFVALKLVLSFESAFSKNEKQNVKFNELFACMQTDIDTLKKWLDFLLGSDENSAIKNQLIDSLAYYDDAFSDKEFAEMLDRSFNRATAMGNIFIRRKDYIENLYNSVGGDGEKISLSLDAYCKKWYREFQVAAEDIPPEMMLEYVAGVQWASEQMQAVTMDFLKQIISALNNAYYAQWLENGGAKYTQKIHSNSYDTQMRFLVKTTEATFGFLRNNGLSCDIMIMLGEHLEFCKRVDTRNGSDTFERAKIFSAITPLCSMQKIGTLATYSNEKLRDEIKEIITHFRTNNSLCLTDAELKNDNIIKKILLFLLDQYARIKPQILGKYKATFININAELKREPTEANTNAASASATKKVAKLK